MLKPDVEEEKKPPVLSQRAYISLKEIFKFKLRQTFDTMRSEKLV